MKRKLYKAQTLHGAQSRVRTLLRQRDTLSEMVGKMAYQVADLNRGLTLLAMLAAKGPCFDNPLTAMEAETLRDKILREKLGLAPDGKPLAERIAAK